MFGVQQLLLRIIASLWRRRHLVLPLLVFAMLPILIDILKPSTFFVSRMDAVLMTLMVSVGLSLAYVALRTFVVFRTLSAQITSLSDRISSADQDKSALKTAVFRISNEIKSNSKTNFDTCVRLEKEHVSLKSLVDQNGSLFSKLSGNLSTLKIELDDLTSKIDESHKSNEELHQLQRELSEKNAPIVQQGQANFEAISKNTKIVSDLVEKVSELDTQIDGLERNSVGLDIAVVARSLRTLWLGGSGFERRTRELEREHGHVLLMDMLALIERENPGSLAGKSLIEIGMTREPYRSQRSTQKLGLFAALLDLRYIGVDIDPENVANAKKILPYLNPGAQSYISKGEDFLRLHSGTIDFVYLDAYDFYHDNHSVDRQEVYKKHLGSEISDEQCWKMHADCAETLIKRLSPDGVVALDDTWKSSAGEWQGKGKLAVPMFIDAGFEIIASSENTVCFKRK